MFSLCLQNYSKLNFYTIIDLPEGEYQYKFIVDGQWKLGKNQVSYDMLTFKFLKMYQVCAHLLVGMALCKLH